MIKGFLFDLDGTLADTAPDLGHALNLLRKEEGLGPLPMEKIRPQASHGARGLLEAGFGIGPEDERFSRLRERFLVLYEQNICNKTRLFDGMTELLSEIESRGFVWGVVTNKPMRFTGPLLEKLGLFQRAASVVSGDTCSKAKPHPEPLLHAAKEMGVDPSSCLYLGDDRRDVEASNSAGMLSIVAAYGYVGDDSASWGAARQISHPQELHVYLQD